mmetsp:Transcript_28944/g.57853  ORF Transcript_28944/g.57853 Transcript_28944/m.57853 type:complete len:269 (-) Transcript_28944:70-876(-)
MVVEPTQQDLLWWQLEEVLQSLAVFQQTHQLGMVLERDGTEQLDLDNLPDQTQDQNLRSALQILRTYVDDSATDSLGCIDHQVEVLHLLVRVAAVLVQRTLINGIFLSTVDQLGQQHTITHTAEKVHRHGVDWQTLRAIGIVAQTVVKMLRECNLLIFRERMRSSTCTLDLEELAGLLHNSSHTALGTRVALTHIAHQVAKLAKLDRVVAIGIYFSDQSAELGGSHRLVQVGQHCGQLVGVNRAIAIFIENAEGLLEIRNILRAEFRN